MTLKLDYFKIIIIFIGTIVWLAVRKNYDVEEF